MRLSDPRNVHEADVCLRAAVAGLRRARAVAGQVTGGPAYVELARARIDRFLDVRMELVRAVEDWEIEAWWCDSWPGSAAPEWPQESGAVVSP